MGGERDTVQVMVVATAAVAEMVMAVAGARAAEREAMVVTATVETEGEREVATEAMEDMLKEMAVDITDKGATQDWTTLQCKLIQTFTIALILPQLPCNTKYFEVHFIRI